MKQIIRSNAVETPSQWGLLGVKFSEYPRQASIAESLVLSPTLNLSVLPKSSDITIKNIDNRPTSFKTEVLSTLLYLVWERRLDFLPIVVIWVCIGKMAKVVNTQGKQITARMAQTYSKTQTLGEIRARAEQPIPKVLALKVNFLQLLPNIRKTTQIATKIAENKTWLKSISRERTQQSSFRNSFFHWELREPLRT
ncbi:hypothetical protein A0J48_013690 [Sphaerospermopsis aphanizomenoides BCCUSP55]|uniref:hypothetical protein n=1 Tax=Sphaerospermopsis aphanizomenoides TaxID=459663 RepID=UPI000A5E4653|nr:hypothetical protein [Sphaerospermopsis aphanizomenoides]MBK1988577.1 hypothetical protein [Sphaerospermopsis aphanizomenoides BCCUSP55]